MALIKCPECGKENVSDTAASCPGCGYNIQAYTEHKNLEAERYRKWQETIQREAEKREKKASPAYRQKKRTAIILAVAVIVACITPIVVVLKIKENKSYEKDLSSVFKIQLGASVDDVIRFEASEFGHMEYETKDYPLAGTFSLSFKSEVNKQNETYDCHTYEFNSDKELQFVGYGFDLHSQCKHAKEIKQRVLKLSPFWDKKSDYEQLIMNGQINGVRCHVICYDYNDNEIRLSYAQ